MNFTIIALIYNLAMTHKTTEQASTFTGVSEHPLAVGAEALEVVNRGSSSSAVQGVAGRGLGQAGGGLEQCGAAPVPGRLLGGGVVHRAGHANGRGWQAGADEGQRVVGLGGAADVLGGRAEVPHGHRVVALFGRVDHDSVRILLGERLLAGAQEVEGWQAEPEKSPLA